jgi:hypothetical protein
MYYPWKNEYRILKYICNTHINTQECVLNKNIFFIYVYIYLFIIVLGWRYITSFNPDEISIRRGIR